MGDKLRSKVPFTNLVFPVRTVSYGPRFFHFNLWPECEDVYYISWKLNRTRKHTTKSRIDVEYTRYRNLQYGQGKRG